MKNRLKELLFGFLIGMSNLIPGFSGGTMALILGIYESMTESIALITKNFKEAFKRLWALGIGIVLGIITATLTIAIALEKWPLITSSFFVGLVIATIPLTFKYTNKRKPKMGAIISFIVCAIVSLLIPIFSSLGFITIDIFKPNVWVVIIVVIIAAIAAATMIIPAASGSMILLCFGLFDPIVRMLKEILVALKNGTIGEVGSYFIIIIPFIIGCIIGIILIAKIITYLFKHHDMIVWYGILGLLFTSVFTIYYNAYANHIALDNSLLMDHLALNIILSVLFLVLGFFCLKGLMKLADKKSKEIEEKEEKEEEKEIA